MAERKILKNQTLHFVQALAGNTDGTGIRELCLSEIDLANTRFEYRLDPDLELLMESIRTEGQQIPVILRGSRPPYQLICGFRRVRSIKAIGGQRVKAIVLENIDDKQAHRLSVLENEERKSLSDLDRANACKRLYDEGRTQEEVAQIMGCSRPKISRYLSLLKLQEPVRLALQKGRITTMHALLLHQAAGLFSAEQLGQLIEQAANKNLSTRELERRIKATGRPKQPVQKAELFKQTSTGFKLSGITYRTDMTRREKTRLITTLEKALRVLTGKEAGNGQN